MVKYYGYHYWKVEVKGKVGVNALVLPENFKKSSMGSYLNISFDIYVSSENSFNQVMLAVIDVAENGLKIGKKLQIEEVRISGHADEIQ